MASDNMDKINEILTSYEDNTKLFTDQDQTHNNPQENTMDAEPQSTEELAAYVSCIKYDS